MATKKANTLDEQEKKLKARLENIATRRQIAALRAKLKSTK